MSFIVIVAASPRAAVAMRCEVLWSLMRGFSSGHAPLSSLPPSVQRELMSGLVMCGAGEQREQFLAEVCGLASYPWRFIVAMEKEYTRRHLLWDVPKTTVCGCLIPDLSVCLIPRPHCLPHTQTSVFASYPDLSVCLIPRPHCLPHTQTSVFARPQCLPHTQTSVFASYPDLTVCLIPRPQCLPHTQTTVIYPDHNMFSTQTVMCPRPRQPASYDTIW